ncbi:hypothetical protein [Yokenella regensburgei]|uniref:hypothetical protein n=1 Tax=Yokenella regensburgei TaxID=158877 RepID=UPI0031D9ECDF
MQTPGLSPDHVHDFCINAVQTIADQFGWGLGYGKLRPSDLGVLSTGDFGELPWPWAFQQYGYPLNEDMLDLSIRIKGVDDVLPGGAALCRIDRRRKRLEICMVENFVKAKESPFSKRVWLSTLIFAHTVAKATDHNEIYVMNPKQRYISLYRKFGFFEDALCQPHLCATLHDIEDALECAMR